MSKKKKQKKLPELNNDTNFLDIVKDNPLHIQNFQRRLFELNKNFFENRGNCTGTWDIATETLMRKTIGTVDKLTKKHCRKIVRGEHEKGPLLLDDEDKFNVVTQLTSDVNIIVTIDETIKHQLHDYNVLKPDTILRLIGQRLQSNDEFDLVKVNVETNFKISFATEEEILKNLINNIKSQNPHTNIMLITMSFIPTANNIWTPFNEIELNVSSNNKHYTKAKTIIQKLDDEVQNLIEDKWTKYSNSNLFNISSYPYPLHHNLNIKTCNVNLGYINNIEYVSRIMSNINQYVTDMSNMMQEIIDRIASELISS